MTNFTTELRSWTTDSGWFNLHYLYHNVQNGSVFDILSEHSTYPITAHEYIYIKNCQNNIGPQRQHCLIYNLGEQMLNNNINQKANGYSLFQFTHVFRIWFSIKQKIRVDAYARVLQSTLYFLSMIKYDFQSSDVISLVFAISKFINKFRSP